MADAFTFHGTDVSTLGVTVVSSTRQRMADVTFAWEQRGLSQGGVPMGGQRIPKRWTDNCYLVGTSAETLRTRMDTLCALIDPRHGDRLYVSDEESDLSASLQRGSYCRINGPINASFEGRWGYRFELNWINVRGTDVGATENTDLSNSGTFNVSVGGNTYAYPVYTFSTGSFTLTNNTTGESMTVASPATDVVVNTWNKTITGTVAGSSANIIGFLTPGGSFPRLQGGTTNSLTLSLGTVDLAWRNEWL